MKILIKIGRLSQHITLDDECGYSKIKTLLIVLSALLFTISGLAFATLAYHNPYIAAPICTFLAIAFSILVIKLRRNPSQKASNNKSKNSNNQSTSCITPEKTEPIINEASIAKKITDNFKPSCQGTQCANSYKDNENASKHKSSPNEDNKRCY